jgi:hypothetical protein
MDFRAFKITDIVIDNVTPVFELMSARSFKLLIVKDDNIHIIVPRNKIIVPQ